MPKVTLIVPMFNEAPFIEACLASVLGQDYRGGMEILVYDGGSTDDSRKIVARIAAGHPAIILLDNPRRIQAAAWNQGIERATGDIIGIVSAHSELAPDYLSMAVETLDRTGADMVGGPVTADSDGAVGEAVALATSTPFGVGGARFHYTDVEEDVDTVYMGVCRAEVYRSLLFDEAMVRNQDDELSYRLLDRGGRIVCNPAIRSRYRNRATWKGVARQYYEYGFWKVAVMRKHPRQVRPRHLIPAALVVAMGGSAALAALWSPGRWALASVIATYAAANIGASFVATRGSLGRMPAISAVYATLHFAYGSGTVVGLLRDARRRFNPG
jgi:glycosyltransferase involved in cell wall biosynthesis